MLGEFADDVPKVIIGRESIGREVAGVRMRKRVLPEQDGLPGSSPKGTASHGIAVSFM